MCKHVDSVHILQYHIFFCFGSTNKKRKLVITSIVVCSRNVHQWFIARHMLVLQAHCLHSPGQSIDKQLLEDFHPQKCRVRSTSSKVVTSSPQCSRYHLLHGHWTCDKDIATRSHNLHLHCFHSILQIHGSHLGKRRTAPGPFKQGVSAWNFYCAWRDWLFDELCQSWLQVAPGVLFWKSQKVLGEAVARLKQRNLLLACACSWLVTYSM